MSSFFSLLLSCSFLIMMLGVIFYASLRPEKENPNAQYAVIFLPSTSHIETFVNVINAGGLPIRSGAFDFIIIASSDDPDFRKKIEDRKPWLVISAIIKGNCLKANKTAFRKR